MATKAQMAKLMQEVFDEEIMFLREQGQKEYAHDEDDAFANFKRIAEDIEMPCPHCGETVDFDHKWVLWVYAMKHREGIVSWLQGHKSQREDVTGRLNDLIVYMLLLRGMIEEEAGAFEEDNQVTKNVPVQIFGSESSASGE